jgi:hypothetical protein
LSATRLFVRLPSRDTVIRDACEDPLPVCLVSTRLIRLAVAGFDLKATTRACAAITAFADWTPGRVGNWRGNP